jgi:hypothetical protein
MDKDLKAKWIAALRSGEYKQGIGVLHHPVKKTYCCLGVLHRVITGEAPSRYWDCDRPNDIMDIDGKVADLTAMNDEGSSFQEIADYIEKHL